MGHKTFGYLKDPVFRGALALYSVTLLVRLTVGGGRFIEGYVNDLLCVGVWVPVLVWTTQRLNLRGYDGPPTGGEVAAAVIVWSVMFELLLPRCPGIGSRHVADPLDVVAYAAGALVCALAWRSLYRVSHR